MINHMITIHKVFIWPNSPMICSHLMQSVGSAPTELNLRDHVQVQVHMQNGRFAPQVNFISGGYAASLSAFASAGGVPSIQ